MRVRQSPTPARPRWLAGGWGLAAVAWLAAAGCNFEVPLANYIDEPRLVSVSVNVAELGPLIPQRLLIPSAAPMAELMPFDRAVARAVVVDANGVVVPDQEVETIWFNCGFESCVFDPELPRCEDIPGVTADFPCTFGAGDGSVEFVVPTLGPSTVNTRVITLFGVIAFDGARAQDCLAARLELSERIEGCAYILRSVKLGPSWSLLVWADSIGLSSLIPISQLPLPILAQAPNRVPIVSEVRIGDGITQRSYSPDELPRVPVRAGDPLTIELVYDPNEQFLQTFFVGRALPESESFLFRPQTETIFERVFTTGDITSQQDQGVFVLDGGEIPPGLFGLDGTFDFAVDEAAQVGAVSRVLFAYTDTRWGEGLLTLEFEVIE